MNMMKIKVEDLHPFPQNPFKVTDNEEMAMLRESIKEFGIITPLIVRPIENGYEIVSGHRRCEACKALKIDAVPAVVKDLTREEAIITMVDSNLHREHILPSEKAFAYRMKMEAIKKQGFRTDLTSDQPGQKFSSADKLAEKSTDSRTQIQRYIRLTNLERPLLNLVDEGRIALTPAVELSFLPAEEQQDLIETIRSEDCTPSLSQASRMRKLSEQGLLSMDAIFKIMTEIKGNQKEVLKIPTERVRKFFKPSTSYRQMEDFIVKALEYYTKHLIRQRDRDSR